MMTLGSKGLTYSLLHPSYARGNERCIISPYLADLHAMTTDDCTDKVVRHFKLFSDLTAVRPSTRLISTSHYCYNTASTALSLLQVLFLLLLLSLLARNVFVEQIVALLP